MTKIKADAQRVKGFEGRIVYRAIVDGQLATVRYVSQWLKSNRPRALDSCEEIGIIIGQPCRLALQCIALRIALLLQEL